MKFPRRNRHFFHFFASLRLRGSLLSLLLSATCATVLWAAPPAWWSDPQTKILDTANPATLEDNYAPANLGQLKHAAKQAKAHLDANLPGGAGTAITTLVTGFGSNLTAEQRDANYAPINLGQLKAVAKPFYDRLLSAGYDTKANLIAHGYPANWAFNYPWNPATPAEDNYAPANIGQLKAAFSFNLSGFDSDGDGLPDSWEVANGLDPNNSDENHNGRADGLDDFDGDGVANGQERADETDPFDQGSANNPPGSGPDTGHANGLMVYTPLIP